MRIDFLFWGWCGAQNFAYVNEFREFWNLGCEVDGQCSQFSKTERVQYRSSFDFNWFCSLLILSLWILIMVNPSNNWNSEKITLPWRLKNDTFLKKELVVCFANFHGNWVCLSSEFCYPSLFSFTSPHSTYIIVSRVWCLMKSWR